MSSGKSRDLADNYTCPRKCGTIPTPLPKRFQYLPLYKIIECHKCEIRWRTRFNERIGYDDHQDIQELTPLSDRLDERTQRMIERLNLN